MASLKYLADKSKIWFISVLACVNCHFLALGVISDFFQLHPGHFGYHARRFLILFKFLILSGKCCVSGLACYFWWTSEAALKVHLWMSKVGLWEGVVGEGLVWPMKALVVVMMPQENWPYDAIRWIVMPSLCYPFSFLVSWLQIIGFYYFLFFILVVAVVHFFCLLVCFSVQDWKAPWHPIRQAWNIKIQSRKLLGILLLVLWILASPPSFLLFRVLL